VNRRLVLLFGVGFVALALFVIFSAGLALPTRNYPEVFHFLGMSRYLLAAALLVFGAVTLAIGRGKLAVNSQIARFAVGAGLVLLGVAFISAPRY